MSLDTCYRPDPRILELGEGFFDPVEAAAFPEYRLRYRNRPWGARLGLGTLDDEAWVDAMARFRPLPGNLESPLALRYHGHQFRHYNPDLGDGRGFLYAQLRDPETDRLLDLGTKGSGRTPYSRGGDGRLTLKGAVREVLATEMLEALGVETSKTMSVVETGEALRRHDEPSPTRAAVLVRLNHSHVRFGSFQRHAFTRHPERVVELLRYAVRHHFPELLDEPMPRLPGRFLEAVTSRSARLAAQWMAAGFVHGVLNTDNMNVTGESFDYGPWRFLPRLDPGFTAAYFDHAGLYAYGRQPEAVRWNLLRLGEALDLVCPALCDRELLARGVEGFEAAFRAAHVAAMLERLGLRPRGDAQDGELVDRLLGFMAQAEVGYEQVLFDWYGGARRAGRARQGPAAQAYQGAAFAPFEAMLGDFDAAAGARLEHAYFAETAPCTMLIDEVEALFAPIASADDWSPLEAKLGRIRRMGEALRGQGASIPAMARAS